jgi:hypothetical protein
LNHEGAKTRRTLLAFVEGDAVDVFGLLADELVVTVHIQSFSAFMTRLTPNKSAAVFAMPSSFVAMNPV